MLLSPRSLFALLLVATLPLAGCLFRSHTVERPTFPAKLQSATRDELVARLNQQAGQIQTLNATVNIATSVGGAQKGKVTEYTEIRGYILVRRPSEIRMVGLFPLVRNTAFDMVSNGTTFSLSIPTKSAFYVGHNDVIRPSRQPLENLRPQHFLDALLLRPIDPANNIAVLESTVQKTTDLRTHKTVEEPAYNLLVLQREGANQWFLARRVVFSREDLAVIRQVVYDKLGQVATDARYGDVHDYNGVLFPNTITIQRPQEEYTVTLTMVKLTLNQPLKDEQFALKQPPGFRLVDLDLPQQAANPAPAQPPQR